MTGLLSALALAAAFQPAAPANDLAGIWEETIGALPVRACFVTCDYGTFGAYYYLSHLHLLGLEAQDGAPGTFSETGGEFTARWSGVQAAGNSLTARWSSEGPALAVRLHRVAATIGEEGACASVAFHQLRLDGIRTVRARGTVDGVAYTKLALDTRGRFGITVESFALDGDSAAVRRINAALGEALAGDPPRWFECINNSLSQGPNEGSEEWTLEPAMISRRWLSVADQSFTSCGGAHPDGGSTYRTFDLASGAEVDLLDWLDARAVKRETYEGSDEVFKTLEPAFRAFLLADWHADPGAAECDGIVRDQDYWNVGLRRDGLVFTPLLPHVVQACGGEFTVTFDRIRPWLTPEAAANIDALRAE